MNSNYTTTMYADVLELWVAALESGEYPQIQGTMCRLDRTSKRRGYCCLGVLCELARQQGVAVVVRDLPDGSMREYDACSSSFVPQSVREWAGLPEGGGNVRLGRKTASHWNDIQGYDFGMIAALIRRHVQPLER